MKPTTPMSCSRQASTTFSSSPALSAWVALCSKWFSDTNRCLKKSISVGLSGILGSRGSAPIRKYLPGLRACSSAPPMEPKLPSARLNSADLVARKKKKKKKKKKNSPHACSDEDNGFDAACGPM